MQNMENIKVKITKRQLKRIIREEYTGLKRRGLIREMHSPAGFGTDIISQIKELERAFYFITTSSSESSAAAAVRELDRVEARMDPREFEIAARIAELKVELEQNFELTSQSGRRMQAELDRLCAQVGCSYEDLV